MSSDIVGQILHQTPSLQTEISLDSRRAAVLPIIDSIKDIGSGRVTVNRDSCMCLCRNERFLLLWSSSVHGIVTHGTDIEARLFGLVWEAQMPAPLMPAAPREIIASRGSSVYPDEPQPPYFPTAAIVDSGASTPRLLDEKRRVIDTALEREDQGDKFFDPERDGLEVPKRPFLLTHAVIVGLAMILVVVVEMACVAKLLSEVRYDGNYMRFALLATVPLFASFSLFFMIVITGSIFQLFGPLSGVQGNSMFYSAKAPKLGRHADYDLPHVTIQMPVYKEGLKGVIIPTVESLLKAVKHYEGHGGTASIYVNDDGMRLVKEDLQEARKAFYELNEIGWCARPKQNDNPDTSKGEIHFVRKGQFKKASNMNYCLDFSLRVEDELQQMVDAVCAERCCTQENLSIEEETDLYEKARNAIIEKDQGRTWAGGNVRLGEIILIIDSDTRVPEDCLLYGALEMHESPEVALLQHASGILQVVNNVFENGITYFTNLIYTSIQFAVGNGDCAPFVGHNTFIRWKAIQSISWFDEEDQMTKFWSDSHVSEDFDVSLRLQMNNFLVRLATYHSGGFKEGVSLTVYDELARWEKYAYGCNELVFHPLIRWPTHGPLTPLFRRFLCSNIKITSKVTILAYIGTYYAIASAIPLTLANYLLVGWSGADVDQFYLTSWEIFVGMAFVFNVLSPLGYAMLRHRLGQATFFAALLETAKWTPMFLLFFGGISYHLAKAILCHFLGIRMEWTTTAKELTDSGFRAGLDRIVRDFKYMYAFCVVVAGGMVYLACYAPRGWRIEDFAAIVPVANQIGCHALLPFALGLF
ncbi:hypothetical protein DIS24_g683 [Lasiodiplodia hormozganensis]|uniref:Glycosyltransferase 2-like domain-containing protein n=1 Tax=Lasiodiplodia hormozganensis TaxID=869390 RepID=A0AA39Z5M7_9PEZI|nr:hypothetical protein DIS24_g683 [Lasiodiplodia hormozganensis]